MSHCAHERIGLSDLSAPTSLPRHCAETQAIVTDFMEQNPFSEAKVSNLSQMNPIPTISPYFSKTHFNIILHLPLSLQSGLLRSGLPTKILYECHVSHACYMLRVVVEVNRKWYLYIQVDQTRLSYTATGSFMQMTAIELKAIL
jgi:hypothetical protein